MQNLELDILVKTFDRLSPIIITEIQKTEQQILLNELTARLEDCIFIDEVQSPKKLYQLFLENNSKTLVFQKEDILQKKSMHEAFRVLTFLSWLRHLRWERFSYSTSTKYQIGMTTRMYGLNINCTGKIAKSLLSIANPGLF